MRKGRPPETRTEPASVYTAFRCPPDILAKAKAAAAKERRSLSNYIICLLDAEANKAE